MPAVEVLADRCLRWIDRANPMLVRCVRQELRNRAALGVYALLLAVGLITALIVAGIADRDRNELGGILFAVVATAWSMALWPVQGMSAFRAITTERQDDTWDMVELTGLRPRSLVLGLIQANLVQGMLFTAALAPFLVMAWLLRGIDLPTIAFALVVIPLGSLAAVAVAVLAACLGANRAQRASLGGLVGLGLIIGWGSGMPLWFAHRQTIAPYLSELLRGNSEALLATFIVLDAAGMAIALCLVFACALLTHRAQDRSSGPRLVWFAAWANAWLVAGGVLAWLAARHAGDFTRALGTLGPGMAIAGVSAAILLGIYAVSEERDLTPRQARAVACGGWRGRLMTVLGPGCARGRLATLAMLLPSLLLGLAACMAAGERAEWTLLGVAWCLACYAALLFAGVDALLRGPLARLAPAPAARRVGLVAGMVALCWLPPLVGLLLGDGRAGDLVRMASPVFGTWQALADASGSTALVGISLCGSAALLLLAAQARRTAAAIRRVQATADDRNPRGG